MKYGSSDGSLDQRSTKLTPTASVAQSVERWSRDPGYDSQPEGLGVAFFATSPGWVLNCISFWHSNLPYFKTIYPDNSFIPPKCWCNPREIQVNSLFYLFSLFSFIIPYLLYFPFFSFKCFSFLSASFHFPLFSPFHFSLSFPFALLNLICSFKCLSFLSASFRYLSFLNSLISGQHLFSTAKLTWRHFINKFHDGITNTFPDQKLTLTLKTTIILNRKQLKRWTTKPSRQFDKWKQVFTVISQFLET